MSARTLVLCAMTLAIVSAAGGQETESPDPLSAPSCVPANGNGLYTASLSPDATWNQVRLYFREVGQPDFYFLEMKSDIPGSYWTTLPLPELGTAAVDTHFVAIAADGAEVTGGPITTPVLSTCPNTLTPEQQAYADNLIVGETTGEQQNLPLAGWECDGVVMRQGVDGAIRPDDVCRQVAMASAAEAAGVVASGGSSLLLPVLGGAVGGAVIGYAVSDDDDPCADCPVSPVFP